MNCWWEVMGSAVFLIKENMAPPKIETKVRSAQATLESRKKDMERREMECMEELRRLFKEHQAAKSRKDARLSKTKGEEILKGRDRLAIIQKSLFLLKSHIDTIKMSELNKDAMFAMRDAATIMRSAGMNISVDEAEDVMDTLSTQLKDIESISKQLSRTDKDAVADDDLDESLALLEPLLFGDLVSTTTDPMPTPRAVRAPPRVIEPVVAEEEAPVVELVAPAMTDAMVT